MFTTQELTALAADARVKTLDYAADLVAQGYRLTARGVVTQENGSVIAVSVDAEYRDPDRGGRITDEHTVIRYHGEILADEDAVGAFTRLLADWRLDGVSTCALGSIVTALRVTPKGVA